MSNAQYNVDPEEVAKFDALVELLKITERDGGPLSEDAVIRSRIAVLACEMESAKMLQRRVISAALTGAVPRGVSWENRVNCQMTSTRRSVTWPFLGGVRGVVSSKAAMTRFSLVGQRL